MTPEPVRRWHVVVEDDTGETYQITDAYIIGTFSALEREVEQAVSRWEETTGRLAVQIELESHGKVSHDADHA